MAFIDDIGSTPPVAPPQTGSGIRDAIRALFPNEVGQKPEPAAPPVDTGYTPGSPQDLVAKAARDRGVDPALALALVDSESGFRQMANVQSAAKHGVDPYKADPATFPGAYGIGQFIPSTARRYNVDRGSIQSQAEGVAHYLSDLQRDTGGDVAQTIRLYKGVAEGGASEEDVRHVIGSIPKYRSGLAAPAVGDIAPAPEQNAEQTKPFDTSDPHMFDGVDTSDPNFFNKKQSGQSDVPVDEIGGLFGELVQARRQKEAADASAVQEQQQAEGAALGGRLRDIAGGLVGPSHIPVGDLPPPAPRSPYEIPPVSDPAAISRGKDRGLEKMSDFDKRIAASPFWSALEASVNSMSEAGVPAPNVSFRGTLQLANSLLANIPSSLMPQTFNAATEATSTGSPAADFVTDVVGQGAGMMITAGGATALAGKLTGAEGILKSAIGFEAYAAPSQAIALGKGESLAKVAAKVPITMAEGALFHKAGAVDNLLGRVGGSAATSAGASAADQLVENGEIDPKEIAKSAGVGAVYGTLGGGGHDAEEIKVKVDQAAHEAATSPLNDVPPPTPAQTEAGNYKKGHVTVQGLDISIENPSGSVRSGETRDGTPWSTTMQDHYGYIRGTKGADGDHVDAFLGPDLTSEKVFVVDQSKRGVDDKPFDEHKVILGARDAKEAREIYTRNYDNNPEERILSLTETTMPKFKQWLKEGDAAKPFAKNEELGIRKEASGGATSSEPAVSEAGGDSPQGLSGQATGRASGGEGAGRSGAEETQQRPIEFADLGNERQMKVGDTKKPVRYALVEADQVITSHDPFTFSPDERYPGENQNPYHSDTAQQASVIKGGAETDWDTILNTTGTSTEGPTVIDPFGNAAGGNGRGMMQKRAYEARPEEAKQAVVDRAGMFGLDPAKARAMDKPMVVRVQQEPVSTSIESRRDIAAQNLSVTKSRRPADEGVNLASRLTDENKSMLASTLGDVDSLTELTKSAEKARPVIKILRDAGQITATNANEYITPDATLTPKGRETVEGMTLGLALPSGDLAQRLPDGYRQKLAENLRPLGAVEAEKGWELHPNLERVLNFVEARKAFIGKGGVKEMYDRQTSLLEDAEKPPPLTDEDRLLLNLLDDPKRTKFKEFMASYASKAAEARAGDVMLGQEPMTRERAFVEANAALGGAEPVPHKPLAKVIDKLNETKAEDDEYIRNSLGKLSAGIDPELLFRVSRRGAQRIAEGLSDFAAWSKRMIEEYGPGVRPHLEEVFARSKEQELLSRADGIGTSLKELRDIWRDPPKATSTQRAVGEYQKETQLIDAKLDRWGRDVNSRFSKLKQEAITRYLNANGDEAVLRDWHERSNEKYKPIYKAALELTAEEKAFAMDARARMDGTWWAANEADILHSYVDGYVRGEVAKAPDDVKSAIVARAVGNGVNVNPSEAMHKTFLNYFEMEQAGYTPGNTTIGKQLVANERSLRRAIAARKMIASLMDAKNADDHRPVFTLTGEMHQITSEFDEMAGKDPATANWVVRPNAKDENTGKYVYIDHPALRGWKWVADIPVSDAGAGKKQSVIMQGGVWVHPREAARIKAVFGSSYIRKSIPEHVPLIGGMRPGVRAQKISAEVKGTVLVGPFHHVGLAKHRLERLQNPFSAPKIDFDNPLLQEGMSHGLMLVNHSALERFNDAARKHGLFNRLPVVGKHFLHYQEYLFQDLIPRWIADSYLQEVPRFEKRYAADLASGKISRDQMLNIVAKGANTAFGETNLEYIGTVFSNKTYRDVLGLVALAPKFLEQRGKMFGQALRPYGAEQRWALLREAAMTTIAMKTLEYLLTNDIDWSNSFGMRYDGREYGIRGNIVDAVHLLTDPRSFVMHRLNPAWTLPIFALATHRDINDNKIDAPGVAAEMLKTWTPIPLQGMWKGYLSDDATHAVINGLMQSAGISNYQYRTAGEKFVFDKAYSKLDMPAKTPEDIFGILPVPAEQKKETMKRALREEMRGAYARKASGDEIGAIVKKYPKLTHEDVSRQRGLARHTPFQDAANNLSAREMAEAFDKHLNDKERELLKPMFARKLRTANPNPDLGGVSNEDKAKYREKYGLAPAR